MEISRRQETAGSSRERTREQRREIDSLGDFTRALLSFDTPLVETQLPGLPASGLRHPAPQSKKKLYEGLSICYREIIAKMLKFCRGRGSQGVGILRLRQEETGEGAAVAPGACQREDSSVSPRSSSYGLEGLAGRLNIKELFLGLESVDLVRICKFPIKSRVDCWSHGTAGVPQTRWTARHSSMGKRLLFADFTDIRDTKQGATLSHWPKQRILLAPGEVSVFSRRNVVGKEAFCVTGPGCFFTK